MYVHQGLWTLNTFDSLSSIKADMSQMHKFYLLLPTEWEERAELTTEA